MRFFILFAAFFTIALSGSSQSQGPNSPNNVIEGGGGQISDPWLNPNNARMQNNIYATIVTTTKNKRTNYLQAQQFGFSIPTGSSILGIVVDVDRYATASGGAVIDSRIELVDATNHINSDDLSTGLTWPTSDTDTYQSYGDPTNTWGHTDWTPAKINSNNFGVAIMAETSNHNTTFSLFVDQIRIAVYYVEGGAQRYAVATGNWSSTSSWALTPGGAPGASVPTDPNDVFIGGGFTITNDVSGVNINSLTLGTTEAIPTGRLTFNANNRDMDIHGGGMVITSNGDILSTFTPTLLVRGDLILNAVLTNRDFILIMDAGSSSTAIMAGTGTVGTLYINAVTTHIGSITITKKLSGVTLGLVNGQTSHLTYSGTTANMDTNVLELLPIGNTVEFSQTTLDAPDFNIQKPSILFHHLIISGNAPKYYNTNISIHGNLTIAPGGILSNQGQKTITLSGDWTNNNGAAGFVPNSCNACVVIFDGNNAQTITNAAGEQFHRVEVAKTPATFLTAANNIIIDNQLLMTSGDFDLGSHSLTGTANLVFNEGELLIGTTGTTVPELTGTYTINDGTIIFHGTGDQTIRSTASTPAVTRYVNVVFAGSGTKSLSGNIDVDNRLSISASAILDVTTSNFNIFNAGEWTNTSTFLPQGGTVTFNGLSQQLIANPAGATYYNLIIDNSALANSVVLESPVTVHGQLTLVDGFVISTSTNLLTLDVNATVALAKDQSHVVGPVAMTANSTSVYTFPIGSGHNYMPASVTPTSASPTVFVAEYFNLEQTVATTTSGVDHVSAQDYWTIQRVSGTADAAVTLVWEYSSAAESEINFLNHLLVAQWNGTDWISQGNTGTTGDFVAGSVTSTAISSFSQPYFVIGSSSIFNPLSNYRYFAAPTGNWSDANVWAYRPGGPLTAPEPTSNKFVVISPGNAVTVQDSPSGQATKAMESLVVYGTIILDDAAGQDITLDVGAGGMVLSIVGNISGTDTGDEIRLSGDLALNNASPISHPALETNFGTQGNIITGLGGQLPILRVNQNNQVFTGNTAYNTLTMSNSATNNGTITVNSTLSGGGILTNGATGTFIFQGTTATGNVINANTPGNSIQLINNTVGTINISNVAVSGTFGNLTLAGVNGFIQSQDVDINGNLTIEAGAVLNNGSNNRKLNIGGNWTNNNGAAGFLNGTNDITFDGSVAQSIFVSSGNEVFNTLVINNTSSTGVTLTQGEVHVTNDLVLTDGVVFTDATNLLVLGDNATSDVGSIASFVDGPMKKIGNEAFVFPVGDGATWARLGLENIAGFDVTTEYTCQYLRTAYSDITTLDPGLAGVSTREHWLLNRVADPGNNANSRVRLFWESATANGIVDLPDTRVGNYYNPGGGLKWYNMGSVVTDNGDDTGSIVSATPISSGPLTFASEFGFALPIELLSFAAAVSDERSVELSWSTASELNNDYFTVQRSANGMEFESLFDVDGAGTSGTGNNYSATDPNPYEGTTYYRLRQTDFDGKRALSKIISVELPESDWTIYPNPTDGSEINLQAPKHFVSRSLAVTIVDSRGIVVLRQASTVSQEGRVKLLPDSTLSNGIYLMTITDGNVRLIKRLIVLR